MQSLEEFLIKSEAYEWKPKSVHQQQDSSFLVQTFAGYGLWKGQAVANFCKILVRKSQVIAEEGGGGSAAPAPLPRSTLVNTASIETASKHQEPITRSLHLPYKPLKWTLADEKLFIEIVFAENLSRPNAQ